MQKVKTLWAAVLAMVITSGTLAGCSDLMTAPQIDSNKSSSAPSNVTDTPVNTGNQVVTNPSSITKVNPNQVTSSPQKPNVSTVTPSQTSPASKVSAPKLVSANVSKLSSSEAKSALAAIQEDENIFQDSEALLKGTNFNVKSVGDDETGEGSIEAEAGEVNDGGIYRFERNRPMEDFSFEQEFQNTKQKAIKNFFQKQPQKAQAARPAIKQPIPPQPRQVNRFQNNNTRPGAQNTKMAIPFANELSRLGAVEIRPDGTIIIYPAQVNQFIVNQESKYRKSMETPKKDLFGRLDKVNKHLENKKATPKASNKKLTQKNVEVKNSSIVKTTNEDGTVTKTVSIEFKNVKTGATKTNKVSKTYSVAGKLIKAEHVLDIKIGEYTRKTTRIMETKDGTTKTTTESRTVWANGKTREVYEERVRNADGSNSGKGTITIKNPDGKVITYNLNTSVSVTGGVISNADDIANDTQVSASGDAEGNAVVTDENGTSTIPGDEVSETEQNNSNEVEISELEEIPVMEEEDMTETSETESSAS